MELRVEFPKHLIVRDVFLNRPFPVLAVSERVGQIKNLQTHVNDEVPIVITIQPAMVSLVSQVMGPWGCFPSSHPVEMRIFYKIPMGKLTLKIVIFQFVMSSFLKSGDFPKSPFPQGKITIFDR